MPNTSRSQGPRSSNRRGNAPDPQGSSLTLSGEGIATNLAGDDMRVKVTEIGSNDSFIKARTIVAHCSEYEDILASLIPLAEKEDLCIIAATGTISHVEFLNRQGTPVPVQRDFQILSLEGTVVYPKENGKNSPSWATVMLAGENGLRGGPVKSLIAKSPVQVFLSTVGKSNLQSKATEDMVKDEKFVVFMNHVNGANEVMDKVYEETLKELNQP